MLSIGQLAEYAGVTIKAVRHYHARGLLEEPPRDSSGYRRYSAEHAILLIKIKTLAEAGVPLARIKELLAADSDRFAVALAEIDRKLQQRADELLRTRKRIARLSAGNRLFVSAEVADLLDQLHELGVSERTVRLERDMWILLQSVSHLSSWWRPRSAGRRRPRIGSSTSDDSSAAPAASDPPSNAAMTSASRSQPVSKRLMAAWRASTATPQS
jgi:DNA-binding transcriptional MerR regulator